MKRFKFKKNPNILRLCFFISLVTLILSCGSDKLEDEGQGEVTIEFASTDSVNTSVGEMFRVQAEVRSVHALKSVSYYLMVDSVAQPQGISVTMFSDPKQYSVDYSFQVTQVFSGFQVVAEDVSGLRTSQILSVNVLAPELAVVFPDSRNDTVYVNVLEPELKLRVLSRTNLQRVSANRLHSNGVNVEVLRVENFSNPLQFDYTLTSSDGINFSDATLVKLRVFADNSSKSSIATVNLSMYSRPVVTFTQSDTLRVNVVDPNKPSPEYMISSSGLSSITTYLMYEDGSVIQHGNVINNPSGISYSGNVVGVNYTENLIGIKVVANDINGHEGEALLPLYCYRDETIPPVITHLQPQTTTIYGSLNPMIRFRAKSIVGLKKLTFYRVLTNEDELLLGEVTSFGNNKDYIGEIPGMQQSYYSSLASIAVLAEDVNGKWSRQLLNVNRDVDIESSNLVAFPGAEGFGKNVTGGRGGQVIYVTTLEDNESKGSLRWAINQSGARTIVFKVSGTIQLSKRLSINNGDLTIAGQTAPGDGVCLAGYDVIVAADNVIIRYMRFRMGAANGVESDALWSRGRKNVVIDHCSMSWSTDECASFYEMENLSLQWCLISESLRNSLHEKGAHGYGAIWGGKNVTFHHNLLAHHDSRNPRFASGERGLSPIDYRNNVIYNWGGNSAYGGEATDINIVNNYYKPGPATSSGVRTRIYAPDMKFEDDGSGRFVNIINQFGKIYVSGNYMDGSDATTNDNWNNGIVVQSKYSGYVKKDTLKASTPFVFEPITQHSAELAYEKVLNLSGANFKRDTIDARVVREVRAKTFTYTGSNGSRNGIIDNQNDVGGWPILESYEAPLDTDNDGMPDAWEIANGLNPNANDANGNNLNSNYTNIEMYMNSLVEHITKKQLKNNI